MIRAESRKLVSRDVSVAEEIKAGDEANGLGQRDVLSRNARPEGLHASRVEYGYRSQRYVTPAADVVRSCCAKFFKNRSYPGLGTFGSRDSSKASKFAVVPPHVQSSPYE